MSLDFYFSKSNEWEWVGGIAYYDFDPFFKIEHSINVNY